METAPRRRGVFPGSFNPLTVAHLDIAKRAREQHGLESIDLIVSLVALGKPTPPGPAIEDRVQLIEQDLIDIPWLSVKTTPYQLIADISNGYDAVIMGADKWQQVNDPSYYHSITDRDEAIARLPKIIVVADRSGYPTSTDYHLETDASLGDVSSTEARAGNRSMMAPAAAAHWQDEDPDQS